MNCLFQSDQDVILTRCLLFQDTVNLMVLIFVDDSPVSKGNSRVPHHSLVLAHFATGRVVHSSQHE